MEPLTKDPEVESERAERGEASAAKRQNPRVLLTVAALLAGLSVAVPAAVMIFVYPLNNAGFYYAGGYWHGEVWWSYVYTGMALSIGCGLLSLVLAIRSERAAYRATEASSVQAARPVGAPAMVALWLALVVLPVGPVVFLITRAAIGGFAFGQWIGLGLLGAGLIGIDVAAWGVSGSDPAVIGRWLLPFAIIAFVLALLGNAHMVLLFGLQSLSL